MLGGITLKKNNTRNIPSSEGGEAIFRGEWKEKAGMGVSTNCPQGEIIGLYCIERLSLEKIKRKTTHYLVGGGAKDGEGGRRVVG